MMKGMSGSFFVIRFTSGVVVMCIVGGGTVVVVGALVGIDPIVEGHSSIASKVISK